MELPANRRILPLILAGADQTGINQKQLSAWLAKNRPDVILTDVAAVRGMLEVTGHSVPRDIALTSLNIHGRWVDGDTTIQRESIS